MYGNRVKKEAAVYSAAILESVCAEILRAAVAVAQSNTFKSKRRNKKTEIIPCYIQLALRRNTNLRVLCSTCSSLALVLEHYLDNDTSKVLLDTDKLSESERTDSEQGKAATDSDIANAAKRQQSWGRRKDDVVTDVDLSNLLRKVHPVYGMSNDARLFMVAIVRTLLAEMMKIASMNSSTVLLDMKMMGAIVNHIMPGKIGSQGRRTAKEAVDRFYLRIFDGETTRIRVRAQDGAEIVGKANFKVNSRIRIGDVINRACSKLRMEKKSLVFVYGGKLINEKKSPLDLGMSTKLIVDIFALPKTWWQFKQREAARRGLLTSAKAQDLSQLKAAKSRVDNQADESTLRRMKGSTSSKTLPHPSEYRNRKLRSSMSATSLKALDSLNVPMLPTPAERRALEKGQRGKKKIRVNKDVFKSRLKQPSKVKWDAKKYSTTTKQKKASSRILKSPETGKYADLAPLKKLPLLPYQELYSEKNIKSMEQHGKQPFNKRKKKKGPRHNKSALFRDKKQHAAEFKALQAMRDKARKHEAALRIQAKFRGVRDRQRAYQARQQRKELMERQAREKRRRAFLSCATALLRDAERSAQTWSRLAKSIRKTRDWVCHEKSYQRVMEDEEQECFKLARQLRAHLRNAQDGTRRLQLNLENPFFEMLEHWEQHLKEDNTLLSGSDKLQGGSKSKSGNGRKQRPMLKGLHSHSSTNTYGNNYRGTKLSPVSEETITQEGIFE